MYNPKHHIVLWVDASEFAVGAILVQHDLISKVVLPDEYMPSCLNFMEQNYLATEWEFIALVSELWFLRHYIVGKPYVVHTNYASLK